MKFPTKPPPPQGEGMPAHVNAKTSDRTGHLEDQNLDLDARTLAILGKRQRLSRNFGYVSLVAFSTTLLASWESIAATFQGGLINGGPSSLIYGLILSWLGSLATGASLAEMASIAPTSGGQYHWTAEFAPVRYATILSWLAGWVSTFARLTLCASAAFVPSQMLQGLIILNLESYKPMPWHGTFLYWAILLLSFSVNVLGIRVFPHLETLAFIFHICLFFILLVPLVYLSPQSTTNFVFADFENSGGWANNGVSWCIGLLTSAWCFSGIDGTSHMSEEVQNAATVVPRSMVAGLLISGTLCIAFSIAILYCVGDLVTALSSPTRFPIIQLFYAATGSKVATTFMTCGLVCTFIFSTFGTMASASRLTWAFARDRGFPFPAFFSHVNKHYRIPVRAMIFVVIVSAILGLVNIGSDTAFNAFLSLALIGHYTSYLLPIILLVMRRFSTKEIPWGPFTLGKWGLPINLFSIVYSVLLLIFMVFPPYQPVTAENMNYASLIFGSILITSCVVWLVYGRQVYSGPVREVIEDMHIR